jgi:hypothetical protein
MLANNVVFSLGDKVGLEGSRDNLRSKVRDNLKLKLKLYLLFELLEIDGELVGHDCFDVGNDGEKRRATRVARGI